MNSCICDYNGKGEMIRQKPLCPVHNNFSENIRLHQKWTLGKPSNLDKNWICYACAAEIVRSGGLPLQLIWGLIPIPHKEGQCEICGTIETLCMYPVKYQT